MAAIIFGSVLILIGAGKFLHKFVTKTWPLLWGASYGVPVPQVKPLMDPVYGKPCIAWCVKTSSIYMDFSHYTSESHACPFRFNNNGAVKSIDFPNPTLDMMRSLPIPNAEDSERVFNQFCKGRISGGLNNLTVHVVPVGVPVWASRNGEVITDITLGRRLIFIAFDLLFAAIPCTIGVYYIS